MRLHLHTHTKVSTVIYPSHNLFYLSYISFDPSISFCFLFTMICQDNVAGGVCLEGVDCCVSLKFLMVCLFSIAEEGHAPLSDSLVKVKSRQVCLRSPSPQQNLKGLCIHHQVKPLDVIVSGESRVKNIHLKQRRLWIHTAERKGAKWSSNRKAALDLLFGGWFLW